MINVRFFEFFFALDIFKMFNFFIKLINKYNSQNFAKDTIYSSSIFILNVK